MTHVSTQHSRWHAVSAQWCGCSYYCPQLEPPSIPTATLKSQLHPSPEPLLQQKSRFQGDEEEQFWFIPIRLDVSIRLPMAGLPWWLDVVLWALNNTKLGVTDTSGR